MRCVRDQRGQTALEYLCVLALVGGVVVALASSGLASTAGRTVATAVCRLFGDCAAPEPPAGAPGAPVAFWPDGPGGPGGPGGLPPGPLEVPTGPRPGLPIDICSLAPCDPDRPWFEPPWAAPGGPLVPSQPVDDGLPPIIECIPLGGLGPSMEVCVPGLPGDGPGGPLPLPQPTPTWLWPGDGLPPIELPTTVHNEDATEEATEEGSAQPTEEGTEEGSEEAEEDERNPAQDKKLSPSEIERLKRGGEDPHEIKEAAGCRPASRCDIYKDRDGNLYVKPKGGRGPGEPTGLNINDF